MKLATYSFLTLALLAGCSNQENGTDAYGNFEATEILVSAETPGKILLMSATEGQTLQKDQLIALIDTTGLYLQKGLTLASMDALESKLQNVPVQLKALRDRQEVLQREKDRFTNLVKEGAATSKQLDDITGELQIVESQLAATESQLSTANRGILSELKPLSWRLRSIQDQLDRCQVRTPADAMVIEKFKEAGEVTAPGQPLYKLAEMKDMILRVYVSGSQLSQVKIGDSAEIRFDGPDGKLKTTSGTISWIASAAEFTPKTIQTREERVNQVYAVKLTVPNDGALKIGMPAEVTFKK